MPFASLVTELDGASSSHNTATQRGLIKLKVVLAMKGDSTNVGFKEALQTIMKQLILPCWCDEDVEDLLDVCVYYLVSPHL